MSFIPVDQMTGREEVEIEKETQFHAALNQHNTSASPPDRNSNYSNRLSSLSFSSQSTSYTPNDYNGLDLDSQIDSKLDFGLMRKKRNRKASDKWQSLTFEQSLDSREQILDRGKNLEVTQVVGKNDEKVNLNEKKGQNEQPISSVEETIKSKSRVNSTKGKNKLTPRPSVLDFNFNLCPTLSRPEKTSPLPPKITTTNQSTKLLSDTVESSNFFSGLRKKKFSSPPSTPTRALSPISVTSTPNILLQSISMPVNLSSPPLTRWISSSSPSTPPRKSFEISPPTHSKSIWNHIRRKKDSTKSNDSIDVGPTFHSSSPALPSRSSEEQLSFNEALVALENSQPLPFNNFGSPSSQSSDISSGKEAVKSGKDSRRIKPFTTLQQELSLTPLPRSRSVSIKSQNFNSLTPRPRSKSEKKVIPVKNENKFILEVEELNANSRRKPFRLSFVENGTLKDF